MTVWNIKVLATVQMALYQETVQITEQTWSDDIRM